MQRQREHAVLRVDAAGWAPIAKPVQALATGSDHELSNAVRVEGGGRWGGRSLDGTQLGVALVEVIVPVEYDVGMGVVERVP